MHITNHEILLKVYTKPRFFCTMKSDFHSQTRFFKHILDLTLFSGKVLIVFICHLYLKGKAKVCIAPLNCSVVYLVLRLNVELNQNGGVLKVFI